MLREAHVANHVLLVALAASACGGAQPVTRDDDPVTASLGKPSHRQTSDPSTPRRSKERTDQRREVIETTGDVLAITRFELHAEGGDWGYAQDAIADMLTTDFSRLEEVRVVERSRTDRILAEQAFGFSDASDSTKAVEVGKLLQATRLVIGSLTVAPSGTRLDLRVVNLQTGEVAGPGVAVDGDIHDVVTLERQAFMGAVRSMGWKFSERGTVPPPPSASMSAITQYYQAKAVERQGRAAEALQLYDDALTDDPGMTAALVAAERLRTAVSKNALVAQVMGEVASKRTQLLAVAVPANRFSEQAVHVRVGAPKAASEPGSETAMLAVPILVEFDFALLDGLISAVARTSDELKSTATQGQGSTTQPRLTIGGGNYFVWAETVRWLKQKFGDDVRTSRFDGERERAPEVAYFEDFTTRYRMTMLASQQTLRTCEFDLQPDWIYIGTRKYLRSVGLKRLAGCARATEGEAQKLGTGASRDDGKGGNGGIQRKELFLAFRRVPMTDLETVTDVLIERLR